MDSIKERLIKVLQENNIVKEGNVGALHEFGLGSLEINSLTFVKIIVLIEDEFDVSFDDRELNFQLFQSIDEIVAMIEKKLKELK
ncbi:phosphopantetheine-binding protein [Paenibacillus bouchesdurhonensis]|uniref:phosphopantetheine-binding protein n=1 Tax=Paenibacillus bouchesdurhonensis TaxID=1870990 RepID=UPI0019002F9A|nr:phosphopantetheine-binding protein [Paenibacillus bouchesdurhonensis]